MSNLRAGFIREPYKGQKCFGCFLVVNYGSLFLLSLTTEATYRCKVPKVRRRLIDLLEFY